MRPDETVQAVREEPNPSIKAKDEYVPPADELRQRHSINIEFLSSGCVVRVGCKSIAFTNYQSALSEINNYVKDPVAAYRKWSKDLNVEIY